MKAILIIFDTLNKRFLEYDWVHAPNFKRLAEKTVIFDNCYCGSLMCIPARRELHTGRKNFLHRSWGPLEPFDDSAPEILKRNGVYSHLVTDHYHYFEDGGLTYHNRYNTWEIVRGHEGDAWKGEVKDPVIPETVPNIRQNWPHWRQDWVNREYMQKEDDQPQAVTFKLGLEFIEKNHTEENWFLHLETFDPHEPYFTHQPYKDIYPHHYDGPHFDWPPYDRTTQQPEQVEHIRFEYASLLSMCDEQLGRVMVMMDEQDLWSDTMLIICTDHGYLLGEHDWWAKNIQPWYSENAHIPLFIWDPRCGKSGERRHSLVQMIDLPATLLDYFGLSLPAEMQGMSLRDTIAKDSPIREAALFGIHGGHINVTDGQYVYMRAPANPENKPLYEYTLMPSHMRSLFTVEELQSIELAPPFNFTKGCRTMRVEARPWVNAHSFGTLLFDLKIDPEQQHAITDPDIERMMIQYLVRLMQQNDSPPEQFERLGLME
ncbi:MAG: sulfatase [Anaerolineales bacterium]|nr:sulfatase [Anaerolineales bacterium]